MNDNNNILTLSEVGTLHFAFYVLGLEGLGPCGKGWLQCYPEKLRVCPKHRWLFLPGIRPVYLDGLFHH